MSDEKAYAVLSLTEAEASVLTKAWGIIVSLLLKDSVAAQVLLFMLRKPEHDAGMKSVTKKLDEIQSKQIDDLMQKIEQKIEQLS